ncbi:MAG: hypothetical protein RLZZ453_1192 [Chlamydiota bacterium]
MTIETVGATVTPSPIATVGATVEGGTAQERQEVELQRLPYDIALEAVKTEKVFLAASGRALQVRDPQVQKSLDDAFASIKGSLQQLYPGADNVIVDIVKGTIQYSANNKEHLGTLKELYGRVDHLEKSVEAFTSACDKAWNDAADPKRNYRKRVEHYEQQGLVPIQPIAVAEKDLQGCGATAKGDDWDKEKIKGSLAIVYDAFREQIPDSDQGKEHKLQDALGRMYEGTQVVKNIQDKLNEQLETSQKEIADFEGQQMDFTRYPKGKEDENYKKDLSVFESKHTQLQEAKSRLFNIDWICLFTNLAFAQNLTQMESSPIEERVRAIRERAQQVKAFVQELVGKKRKRNQELAQEKWIQSRLPGFIPGSLKAQTELETGDSSYAKEIADCTFDAFSKALSIEAREFKKDSARRMEGQILGLVTDNLQEMHSLFEGITPEQVKTQSAGWLPLEDDLKDKPASEIDSVLDAVTNLLG